MISMEGMNLMLTASAGAARIGAVMFVGAGVATADTETHRPSTTSQASDSSDSSDGQSVKTPAAERDRSKSTKRAEAESKPESDATENTPSEKPRRFGAESKGRPPASDATVTTESV